MHYFFQVLFKGFFRFIIWLELSLFDCVTEDCLHKKKSYKIYHTCDRVAMLQLEICKFLAGDLVL